MGARPPFVGNRVRGFARTSALCRGPESNWRHMVLQTIALPTELPRREPDFTREIGASHPAETEQWSRPLCLGARGAGHERLRNGPRALAPEARAPSASSRAATSDRRAHPRWEHASQLRGPVREVVPSGHTSPRKHDRSPKMAAPALPTLATSSPRRLSKHALLAVSELWLQPALMLGGRDAQGATASMPPQNHCELTSRR